MTSLVRRGLTLLRAPAAEVGFALRRAVRWSRGAPAASVELGDPFAWAPAAARAGLQARADALLARYDLAALRGRADAAVWCANVARLCQLERLAGDDAAPCGPDGVVRAADLGCGDFHYAAALQQWLSRGPAGAVRSVVLRGLELDGYGVYRDGRSRVDHARARAAAASVGGSTVRFEVADAAAVRLPEQDVVSLFFPFLTAYASLQWGAPLSRLRPRRLLGRAVASLRPGGWLLVANQTPREYARLVRLLRGLPVTRIARASFATDLVPGGARTAGQVGSLWRRDRGVPSGARNG